MPDVERPLRSLVPYIRTLAGAMQGWLTWALILTVLGALTEGVGLLVLVPLLHLIGVDVQHGTVGRVARLVAAAFVRLGLPLNLISVLAVYVALIAIDASVRRCQTVTYCSLQVGFTAYLRK